MCRDISARERFLEASMREAVLVVTAIVAVSCGQDGGGVPVGASPTPPQQTFTLSGTVSETSPTATTRVAGARLIAIAGLDATGPSTTSDANGVFQLSLAPGSYTLRTHAPTYAESSQPVTVMENHTVSVQLDPAFQMVTTTRQDAFAANGSCPGYWDFADSQLPRTNAAGACEIDYVFNMHHDGTLTAGVAWVGPDIALTTDLYRGIAGAAEGNRIEASDAARGSYAVYAHTQYIVRVRRFSNGGGPPPAASTQFTLTVTHPS
jgi:hypothetical protein